MFGLGTKQDKPRTSLVISIGSSSVRASFVRDTKPERPIIVWHDSVSFRENDSDFEQYKKNMTQACSKLIEKSIQTQGFSKPETIMCVLEKPWYVSQTYTYTQDSEHEFTFKKSTIADILKEHVAQGKRHVEKNFFNNTHTSIIEKKVVHLAVNGYEVAMVSPKTNLRTIDVTSYISFTSENILQEITQAIHRHIHHDVDFATSSFASLGLVKALFEDIQTLMLVSVSEHSTEMSFLEHGAMRSTAYFPKGTHELHRLDQDRGIHTNTLLSHLRLMGQNTTELHSSDPHIKSIQKAFESWRVSFAESLQNFSHKMMKSDIVILLVDKDYAQGIERVIQDARNSHLSRSGSVFRVILISMDDLEPYIGSYVQYPNIKNVIHTIFAIFNN